MSDLDEEMPSGIEGNTIKKTGQDKGQDKSKEKKPKIVAETKKIVLAKGLDAAELYATQLTGTDENTELSRVLEICRKNKLSPEAIAQVLDNLKVIESGKW